jgi:hypothetical protein
MTDTFDVITRFYGAAYYQRGTLRAVYEATTPTHGTLIINGNLIYHETKSIQVLLRDHGVELNGWTSKPELPMGPGKRTVSWLSFGACSLGLMGRHEPMARIDHTV